MPAHSEGILRVYFVSVADEAFSNSSVFKNSVPLRSVGGGLGLIHSRSYQNIKKEAAVPRVPLSFDSGIIVQIVSIQFLCESTGPVARPRYPVAIRFRLY